MEKLRVAVSACLLGKKVRYDGGHKLDRDLIAKLSERFALEPVCPEYEAGLGVPREAMRLVGNPIRPRLWTIASGQDVTEQLVGWCQSRAQEVLESGISGVVLKSRSPSCGLALIDIHSAEGVVVGEGPGLFVRVLMERVPRLPLIESASLTAAGAFDRFVARAEEYGASF